MASAKDLKRRLKASDRRRARRPIGSAATGDDPHAAGTVATGASVVDGPGGKAEATDRVVRTILEFAPQCEAQVCDALVVSAMRGCFQGKTPSDGRAKQLSQQLEEISRRNNAHPRIFRQVLSDLLALAAHHRNAEQGDAFVKYLDVLSQ